MDADKFNIGTLVQTIKLHVGRMCCAMVLATSMFGRPSTL